MLKEEKGLVIKMKNILKRNQIIILVIALMLVSAGYLSYSGNKVNEQTSQTSTDAEETQVAGIGDAKLVSSNAITEENNQQVAIVPNNEENTIANEIGSISKNENMGKDVNSEQTSSISSTNTTNSNETKTTQTNATASKENNQYFSESRLNRETMYSQMIESYQKILENQNISEAQKTIAQTEIHNINETKNKIMICENLVKTKGFSDLVIFVNDKSVSVVVKAEKLEQDQIAQIQNIIAREMNAEVSNIHISNK